MITKENLPICLLVFALMALCIFFTFRESFSTSGMTISDDYCGRLTDIYYDPANRDPKCRHNARNRICGHERRNTIDYKTGNYYTENGVLI